MGVGLIVRGARHLRCATRSRAGRRGLVPGGSTTRSVAWTCSGGCDWRDMWASSRGDVALSPASPIGDDRIRPRHRTGPTTPPAVSIIIAEVTIPNVRSMSQLLRLGRTSKQSPDLLFDRIQAHKLEPAASEAQPHHGRDTLEVS
jgi:hypothetical protein